jgi:hypothetical protein
MLATVHLFSISIAQVEVLRALAQSAPRTVVVLDEVGRRA